MGGGEINQKQAPYTILQSCQLLNPELLTFKFVAAFSRVSDIFSILQHFLWLMELQEYSAKKRENNSRDATGIFSGPSLSNCFY